MKVRIRMASGSIIPSSRTRILELNRFDGRVAIHCLSIPEALTVDANCDVWFLGDGVQVMRCTGIDSTGKPIMRRR